jgi:hypothetical protein
MRNIGFVPAAFHSREWDTTNVLIMDKALEQRYGAPDIMIHRARLHAPFAALIPRQSRMPEIGTSGSMSGDGRRSVGHRPQATAPILDSTEATDSGDDASWRFSRVQPSCCRHSGDGSTQDRHRRITRP